MDMYYKSVGRNATLIVGLTPDNRGLVPEPDVQRLKEWGDEIKKIFSTPAATTSGKGKVILLNLKKRASIRYLVVQENIAMGHRVKNFRLQALVKGKWLTITEGSAIGHKFIYPLKQPVATSKLRLVIDDIFAEPDIIHFSAYQ